MSSVFCTKLSKMMSLFSKSKRLAKPFSTTALPPPTTAEKPTQTTPRRSAPPPASSSLPKKNLLHVGPLNRINYDFPHYIIQLSGKNFAFDSGKSLLAFYVRILGQVLGSEEEAKKNIYFVSPVWNCLSFGAYIDEATATKLSALPDVSMVIEDFYAEAREKSPIAQSTSKFVPYNWGRRLFNLYEYYLSSKGNHSGDPGQWIIKLVDNSGVSKHDLIDYYINLLSQVGNSVKEAKERIYLIWTIEPFGFAAEMEEATANKLKGIANVEEVFPDYDSLVKKIDDGGLVVSPPLCEGSDPRVDYIDLAYNEDEEFAAASAYGTSYAESVHPSFS